MENLQLPLKKQWFEMTDALIKKEDYREITPYWLRRLMYTNTPCDYNLEDICDCALKNVDELKFVLNHYGFKFKSFTQNTMTLGYPKSTDTERILKLDHAGIEIRTGKPKWGAEPGKLYFVIKHGKRC